VLLSGEPGIGKSRLTAALDERIEKEPHTRLRYFCSPQWQDSALHPFVAQLERAAGFEREDTLKAKLDKLGALAPASPEDRTLLAELLSLPTEGRLPSLELSPQRKKEKTFEALLQQLEAFARQRPVLMLFEDVHWIDPSSRELLDLVVERVPRLPVLVLITYRPEFQPSWSGQSQVTVLVLNRLDREQGATLVREVVGAAALPADVVAEIVKRTDGVPLFVEEMVKAILEGGYAGTASPRVGTPAANVPATLHASLMARLDRLGSGARELAQVGAVLGREFSYELLAAIAQRNAAELDAALDQLVVAGLAFRRGAPPQATFIFKHALVQDAAYGTLLRGQRQKLHERVAQLLEEWWPETAETQPELLAHHCAQAGLAERAIAYYTRAGQRAVARSAMAEAISQLRKGLELLTSLPDAASRQRRELELQIALGRALIAAQGYGVPEVGETYARARGLCEQLDRPPEIVPVLYGQCLHYIGAGLLRQARKIAADLLQAGEDRAVVAVSVLGHRLSGSICFNLGEFLASQTHLEKGLALFDPGHRSFYRSFQIQDPVVNLLGYHSINLFFLGYFDQARLECEKAVEEGQKIGHAFSVTSALSGACQADWGTRSREEVLARADALIAVADEHGFPFHRAVGTIYRGWALAGRGETGQGIALLRAGLAASRATEMKDVHFYLILLADAEGMAKGLDEGLGHLAEAERLMGETRWAEAELHRVRGELLCAGQDHAGAERSLCRAINIAQQQGAKFWELRAATSLARLWYEQGKRDVARELLAPIYGWFTEGFDTPVLKEANALLGTLTS
jgi:tetratricopeptide (TPR) repeat protein